jgi:hypothetical protein
MIYTFKIVQFQELKEILPDVNDFFVILDNEYCNGYTIGQNYKCNKLNPDSGFNQMGYSLYIYSEIKEHIKNNPVKFYKVYVPENDFIFVCKKEEVYTILSDSITICECFL